MSTGLIWTISGDLATGFPVKEYSVCSNLQLKDFLLTFFKTLFDLFFSALRFFRRQIHRRVCSEVARVVWRVGEGGARDLEQVFAMCLHVSEGFSKDTAESVITLVLQKIKLNQTALDL